MAWVPGAIEIPLVAQRLAEAGNYEAIIAIGCVIGGIRRSDLLTTHYCLVLFAVGREAMMT